MGAKLCSQADADAPLETLCFHAEAKGAQVLLDAKRSTACRLSTFHDGIVFSQRPVRPGECVALRVLGQEDGWYGGLRVGFTRLNPACVLASSLPPFVCPDLEEQSPTWAAGLPGRSVLAGDLVCFWVNRPGWLCAQVNRGPGLLLRKGLPTDAPLWAVMDVYGTTTAIELLDPAARAFPTALPWALAEETPADPEAGEECAICFHHAANVCLVPCGHTQFCNCCAWRVFRDTAKCPMCRWHIKAVVPAWGHPTQDRRRWQIGPGSELAPAGGEGAACALSGENSEKPVGSKHNVEREVGDNRLGPAVQDGALFLPTPELSSWRGTWV